MRTRVALWIAAIAILPASGPAAPAAPLVRFDLRQAAQARQWVADHDVRTLTAGGDGLHIAIGGEDPYIHGPAADFPAGTPLWLHMRVRSDIAGSGQVFFFSETSPTTETNSVHLPILGGRWTDVRVPAPALGRGARLRFDPPGTRGACVLAAIWFTPRILLPEPRLPLPAPAEAHARTLTVRSGALEVAQSEDRFDAFAVRVAGRPFAASHGAPSVGYLMGRAVRWAPLGGGRAIARREGAAVVVTARARDAEGGVWTLTRTFAPASTPGAIDITTTVRPSARRVVAFLPMLTVMPGLGDPAFRRNQGIFCGLEYLDAPDRSSSEDDIIGPGALRRVPDTLKITIPMMAMQSAGRYLGLIWRTAPGISALFDTPDRVFGSGAHVMGLLFPGSNGMNRPDGALMPYDGVPVDPSRPVIAHATLIGGIGASILPAVRQTVAMRGLPPVPGTGMDAARYAAYAARAWLDTGIQQGAAYRHAYWPGSRAFGPTIAADPPVWMRWLAQRVTDPALAARLRSQAAHTIARVRGAAFNEWNVSHVRLPAGSLVFGSVNECADRAREEGRAQATAFEPDGTVPFRRGPTGLDFARTHFSREANGTAAPAVATLLERATLSGDRALLAEGLRRLQQLARFDNTVPRGAQTWEVPLHTPDIMASAHLVRAYTLGYEITGNPAYRRRAIDWAWTGVPFVYLRNPTGQPIGPYATISVLGATTWQAPNWMGMPVQWCGLVYADALYRLARHDPSGPWVRIANGVAASGVQQSFPPGEPGLHGLLPDSVNLRPQTRNGVAINPGTVQSCAIRLVGGPELYDFRAARRAGLFVHAPGSIGIVSESAAGMRFRVAGWPDTPYYVLVTGLRKAPAVRIGGRVMAPGAACRYVPDGGRLILRVTGHPVIEVRSDAP